ncbi:MAG TPA: phytanoyl-CoA dioxygenase family protein [Chloroflexia bacterium]|nr:phytanoyl-CoA dioxygenase family protein [Chloroflexia bacterium]
MTEIQINQLDRIAEEFEQNGFVKLEQVIAPAELEALREDTRLIIEGGYEGKANESDYFHNFDNESGQEVFHRVQYVFPKAPLHNSLLILLAQPFVLEVLQRILGEDFLCAAEALVFKMPRNGREVAVHADCNPADPGLSPDHLIFNVDFYLDESTPENGCLLVVPGSHKWHMSSKEISERGWDFPGMVEVPMKAGDVLLHNTRLVHGSHTSRSTSLRRTLYYEFDSIHWLLKEGSRPQYPITEQWINDRLRLLMRAIDLRKAAPYARNEKPFPYRLPKGYELAWPNPAEEINLRPAMGYSKYF